MLSKVLLIYLFVLAKRTLVFSILELLFVSIGDETTLKLNMTKCEQISET